MKKSIVTLFAISVLLLVTSCNKKSNDDFPNSNTDRFTVTVNNGYGSGEYKTGDTVHIFSNAYTTSQIFDKWSGDISALNASNEWHTWFIMPNRDLTFTGNILNISPFALQFSQIMGRDRLKPVYYFFPTGHKGIVYLLHGTNGSADNLVSGYEWRELIKNLVYNKFAVIITECEEATTGIDANADGKLRWALIPADTITNVDYANIRIITNYFINSNITSNSKPRYSIGMSDGGFFSAGLAYIYQFKSSVQYCAQGSSNLMQVTNIPTQFCMTANDDNASVGATGNADALSNYNSLNNKGVCSKYFINPHSPIYPERFARDGNLTTTQSIAVYDELKSKGYLDIKNFFKGYSNSFLTAYGNNPTNFPVFNSLSSNQRLSVLAQINISVADHHIYSDLNNATIKFLNTQCQ